MFRISDVTPGTRRFVSALSIIPVLLNIQMAAAQSHTQHAILSREVAASGVEHNGHDPQSIAHDLAIQVKAAFILDHDHDKARRGFLRVTELDPTRASAWFNLGVLAESDQQWGDAARYFSEYLRQAPGGPDAMRAKSQLKLLDKAVAGLIEPADLRRDEYNAMIQRARAFMAVGLFREAIAEAGRAQESDPTKWESYAVVSLCMARQNKRDAALRFRTQALDRAPVRERDRIGHVLSWPPAK